MLVRESRVQPPSLDTYSDMPLFNTKAVVHQTGVPAPTLRAWERRYGILTPRRGENDYRLYSERDMATVTWLRERVESGMTISQAIALLRSMEPARKRGRRTRALAPTVSYEPRELVESRPLAAPTLARFSLDDMHTALLHQFMNLDEYSASRTTAQALAVYSVEEVCLSLFVPVLAEVGRMWAAGEVGVTVEHFASALVRAQLDSLFRSAATGETGPLAIVGCAPGETHELGALMLALFLRRAGLHVVYLGQNVEVDGLMDTIITARPACVLLSASLRPHAEALVEVGERLTTLETPTPTFYYGGFAFYTAPDLAKRIRGTFLGMDASAAAHEIKRRLSA